jgi:hypothetical protein
VLFALFFLVGIDLASNSTRVAKSMAGLGELACILALPIFCGNIFTLSFTPVL